VAKQSKGSAYERSICRAISLWWTRGERDDVFWRTAGSGAMSKARAKIGKRTHGQYADVLAVDPIGSTLLDVATIELKKGYNKATIHDVLDKAPAYSPKTKTTEMHPQPLERFIGQVREDSINSGALYWILIHARDRRKSMVLMPWRFYADLANATKSRINEARPKAMLLTAEGLRVFCTPLENFFNLVDPSHIRELSRGGQRGRKGRGQAVKS